MLFASPQHNNLRINAHEIDFTCVGSVGWLFGGMDSKPLLASVFNSFLSSEKCFLKLLYVSCICRVLRLSLLNQVKGL